MNLENPQGFKVVLLYIIKIKQLNIKYKYPQSGKPDGKGLSILI